MNHAWVMADGLNVRDISKVWGYKGEGIQLLSTDALLPYYGGKEVIRSVAYFVQPSLEASTASRSRPVDMFTLMTHFR
jgi:hypothetical protein